MKSRFHKIGDILRVILILQLCAANLFAFCDPVTGICYDKPSKTDSDPITTPKSSSASETLSPQVESYDSSISDPVSLEKTGFGRNRSGTNHPTITEDGTVDNSLSGFKGLNYKPETPSAEGSLVLGGGRPEKHARNSQETPRRQDIAKSTITIASVQQAEAPTLKSLPQSEPASDPIASLIAKAVPLTESSTKVVPSPTPAPTAYRDPLESSNPEVGLKDSGKTVEQVLQENLSNQGTVVVKVSKEDCPPCKKADEELSSVGNGYKLEKVDKSNSPEQVTSYPTFFVYKNNKKVGRFHGYTSKDSFEQELKKYL